MKFCKQIKNEEILKVALSLVNSAQRSVDMTMDLDAEINNPLPQDYHNTLNELYKKKVRLSRYTYGTKKYFFLMKKKYPHIKTVYKGGLVSYQRMLIIDRSFGLFALSGNVYFTSFLALVQSLLKYVKIL